MRSQSARGSVTSIGSARNGATTPSLSRQARTDAGVRLASVPGTSARPRWLARGSVRLLVS